MLSFVCIIAGIYLLMNNSKDEILGFVLILAGAIL